MNVVALIFFIVAAVLFLVGDRLITQVGAVNLGLAVLTVGFIIQFTAESHSVTF